jgi:hypothetical protein
MYLSSYGVTINATNGSCSAPTANDNRPTCAVTTETVTITGPLEVDFQYNVDGGAYQSSEFFIINCGTTFL